MPDETIERTDATEQTAPGAPAPRATRGRAATTEPGPKPAARKPRVSRTTKATEQKTNPVGAIADAPPVPVVPAAVQEDVARAGEALRQVTTALEDARGRRDELLASIAAAELRLAELRRQAMEAAASEDALRQTVDATRGRIEESVRQAAEVRREADETSRLFDELTPRAAAARDEADQTSRVLDELAPRAAEVRREADETTHVLDELAPRAAAVRGEAEALRGSLLDAEESTLRTRERADEVRAEAARAKEFIDRTWEQLRVLKDEFGSLNDAARQTLGMLGAIAEQARTASAAAVEAARGPVEPEPDAETPPPEEDVEDEDDAPVPVDPATALLDSLDGVAPLPPDGVTPDARDRLIRYLNDAVAVEREQIGLLQALADATDDPDLRTEYERQKAVVVAKRHAVERRVTALGGQPAGGRGLLGQIAARVWDAIQKPDVGPSDPVEDLLKALSAAEITAGMYLAICALARSLGDAETADVAAALFREERTYADRVRARLAPAAVRTVTRATPAPVESEAGVVSLKRFPSARGGSRY